MKTENLFILGTFSVIVLGLSFLFAMDGPKPAPIPTEAEMVMMERMAKLAATAQGECE